MNSVAVANSLIGYKLPYDLIEYIWSFNYFWASTIIQKYTKKYISNKVENIYEMVGFAHHKCHLGCGISNYSLFYKNKVIKNSDVLTTLNACKCCVRHQINKPKNMESWVETEFGPDYTNIATQDTLCSCPCRHLARFICREVNDE
tara:strand:+ start:181 stop:618 length:438 start_codon:yes stop_codon:yes gene_type:complete